jgi:hypothetical protein
MSISPVSAFSISYPEFYFFITEPTIIDYEELFFSVANTQDESLLIQCGYDKILGINVSVEFTWDSTILEAGKSVSNRYKIIVNEALSTTFPVEISCIAYSLNNETGNKLVAGAVVVNRIEYYSETEGYFLNLNIIDQSGKPLLADIRMYHKINTSYPYSPIGRYNDSNIQGYFPRGWYLIQAEHIETGIDGSEQFFLGNDSNFDVELALVGFRYFEPIDDGKNHLGINATINNYVDMLYEVEIFATLYKDGKQLDETNKDYWQEFPRVVDHKIKFWFSYEDWEIGEYEIVGYIYSSGEEIASKFKIMNLSDVPIKTTIPDYLIISLGIVVGVGLTIIITKLYNNKRMRSKYAEVEKKIRK